MTVLTLQNFAAGYGEPPAIENVSFEVEDGDYLFVVGENGSGKTTLIKGILGLVPARTGRVLFHGVKRSDVGYLPQKLASQRDFPATVFEIALSGAHQNGLFYDKKSRDRAAFFLKRFDVLGLKDRGYRELSGGEQQRVLLARALTSASRMLILDEPAASLDQNAASELYAAIRELNEKDGVSVLLVSHDLKSAAREAKKILHIDRGVAFYGAAADYEASDARRAYFGGGKRD